MAMFSSMMRDFNDDFFSGPMESMRRMESMMDNMMAPFGGMFGSMAMQPIDNRPGRNNNSLMPFGFGRSLFPNMDDMFANFTPMGQDPNCHSFSSSSVMTYTTDESGRPQVYHHSASTRTAPGGVKETRETVQDSRSGLQKMAIGHHLDDKAHVIEKKKFKYTGEEEENHEYVNLDDEEADTFDNEWQQKAQAFQASRQMPHHAVGYGSRWRERSPDPDVLAITDGSEYAGAATSRPAAAEHHPSSGGHKKKSGFLKKKSKHGSPSRKQAKKPYE